LIAAAVHVANLGGAERFTAQAVNFASQPVDLMAVRTLGSRKP